MHRDLFIVPVGVLIVVTRERSFFQ